MTHEEAVEHLYELHFGELDEATRASLEAHLAECPDCRSFEDTYEVLRAALSESHEPAAGHPSPEEIVAHAVGDGSQDPDDRRWIAEHVAACESCEREASLVRRVEARSAADLASSKRRPRPRGTRRGPWLAVAVAAVGLLAALVYPAYLGVGELLREEPRIPWSGPIQLQTIRSPLRQGAEPARIRIDRESPLVALAVELTVPREVPPSAMLRFEILDSEGRPLSTEELPAKEARAQIRSSGVVTLLVPTASLAEGRVGLRVFRADRPQDPPLLEVSLDVVASPPDPDARSRGPRMGPAPASFDWMDVDFGDRRGGRLAGLDLQCRVSAVLHTEG
jgi:anti-sigma factor RsiW